MEWFGRCLCETSFSHARGDIGSLTAWVDPVAVTECALSSVWIEPAMDADVRLRDKTFSAGFIAFLIIARRLSIRRFGCRLGRGLIGSRRRRRVGPERRQETLAGIIVGFGVRFT